MNFEKFLKKEILCAQIFVLIGIISGIAGFVFEYQRDLMLGLTAGFLPTGIGMLVIYKNARKKPKMQKNIELQNEERNIFINTKAGHAAFWISYWYIFAAVIFHYSVRISLHQFLIATLIFMPLAYFTLVVAYHKKY
jgi:hypothetical protein